MAAGSGKIAVPMQGTIVKVLVEAGQTVADGDPLVVLEAMKMENNVNSDIDGTVAEVKVEPGQSVAAGEVVVVVGRPRSWWWSRPPRAESGSATVSGRPRSPRTDPR